MRDGVSCAVRWVLRTRATWFTHAPSRGMLPRWDLRRSTRGPVLVRMIATFPAPRIRRHCTTGAEQEASSSHQPASSSHEERLHRRTIASAPSHQQVSPRHQHAPSLAPTSLLRTSPRPPSHQRVSPSHPQASSSQQPASSLARSASSSHHCERSLAPTSVTLAPTRFLSRTTDCLLGTNTLPLSHPQLSPWHQPASSLAPARVALAPTSVSFAPARVLPRTHKRLLRTGVGPQIPSARATRVLSCFRSMMKWTTRISRTPIAAGSPGGLSAIRARTINRVTP